MSLRGTDVSILSSMFRQSYTTDLFNRSSHRCMEISFHYRPFPCPLATLTLSIFHLIRFFMLSHYTSHLMISLSSSFLSDLFSIPTFFRLSNRSDHHPSINRAPGEVSIIKAHHPHPSVSSPSPSLVPYHFHTPTVHITPIHPPCIITSPA
jgi:hypothetical protein